VASAPPAAASGRADPLTVSRQRLEKMVKENKQAEVLYGRLREQESRLADLLDKALYLRDRSLGQAAEFQDWEEKVRACVQQSAQRGATMAMEGLFDSATESNKFFLAKLANVKSDASRWQKTLESLQNVNDFLEYGNAMVQIKEVFDWTAAKRELMKDIDFINETFPNTRWNWFWRSGRSIVDSSVDVMKELQGLYRMRELDGITAYYKGNMDRTTVQIKKLVAEIKSTRAQVSKETGLSEAQLLQLTLKRSDLFPRVKAR
jgi:hypothetical protein